MKRFVVLGASPQIPSDELLSAAIKPDSLVIFADGGASLEKSCPPGTPFAFVGDCDSASVLPDNCMRVMLPREKNQSDLEAAVDLAIENGADEVLLLGCTGGRLDHFVAAVGVLEKAAAKCQRAFLIDENNLMFYQDSGNIRYPDLGYDYFSVIPLDEKLIGVSLSGLKYTLDDDTLRRNASIGVSNEFLQESAYVSIRRGAALIIYSSENIHVPDLDFKED